MAQLRQDKEKFDKLGCTIVVVGPEDARRFREFFGKESLPFIGLPDPDHSVLTLYGQEVSIFKLGRMPAQVLIDSGGTARFVYYGHSMKDIPDNETILAELRSFQTERE